MANKRLIRVGGALVTACLVLSSPVGTARAAEGKVAWQTANVLGLPLHRGRIQLSCPFLKIDATITQADRDRVVFASNYKNVSIAPDASRPGGIRLDYGSSLLMGSVEKGANRSVLSLDNVGTFTISLTEGQGMVISGVLPFDISVTYVY